MIGTALRLMSVDEYVTRGEYAKSCCKKTPTPSCSVRAWAGSRVSHASGASTGSHFHEVGVRLMASGMVINASVFAYYNCN